MKDDHWAIQLYERYVTLFGDPIEQPIKAEDPKEEEPAWNVTK